jgi:hypothetical protein
MAVPKWGESARELYTRPDEAREPVHQKARIHADVCPFNRLPDNREALRLRRSVPTSDAVNGIRMSMPIRGIDD